MGRVMMVGLAVWFLGARACRADQPDPRALVLKAVKAQGGVKNLRPATAATRVTFAGIDYSRGGIKYTAVFYTQTPDRVRMTYHFQGDSPSTLVFIRNGNQAWEQVNGETEELGEASLTRIKTLMHADRVAELTTLLSDKSFVLSFLGGESKVNDRSTLGVLVSRKDQAKVRLEFDKEDGAVRKVEVRFPDFSTEESVYDEVYTDYREVKAGAADEEILKAAKLPSDGPALLAFLRKQVLTDADRRAIEHLVHSWVTDRFKYGKASAGLVARGAPALAYLHKAMKSDDAEVVRRAERCAGKIEQVAGVQVLKAATRLVALRKPKGAAEVLLAYVPSASGDAVAREVKNSLLEVAYSDGKPDAALVKALTGPEPFKGLAAAALGRDGGAARRQPGRRLFLHGVKRPTKGLLSRDGVKLFEWTITDMQFFNKLDDALFARP